VNDICAGVHIGQAVPAGLAESGRVNRLIIQLLRKVHQHLQITRNFELPARICNKLELLLMLTFDIRQNQSLSCDMTEKCSQKDPLKFKFSALLR